MTTEELIEKIQRLSVENQWKVYELMKELNKKHAQNTPKK